MEAEANRDPDVKTFNHPTIGVFSVMELGDGEFNLLVADQIISTRGSNEEEKGQIFQILEESTEAPDVPVYPN